MSLLFEATDRDGDKVCVDDHQGPEGDWLSVSVESSSEEPTRVAYLEPWYVNELHTALGAWMAKNGITARAAVTPDAPDANYVGEEARMDALVQRVSSLETRQSAHDSALVQDAERIGNLNSAVNRAHRRIDAMGDANLNGAVNQALRRLDAHQERLTSLEEFNGTDAAAEETGEIVKGLAYLRATLAEQHNFDRAQQTHQSNALTGLLTGIRDALSAQRNNFTLAPGPGPEQCGHLGSGGLGWCTLLTPHAGEHINEALGLSWPQDHDLCEASFRGDGFGPRCVREADHTGRHNNPKEGVSWPQES